MIAASFIIVVFSFKVASYLCVLLLYACFCYCVACKWRYPPFATLILNKNKNSRFWCTWRTDAMRFRPIARAHCSWRYDNSMFLCGWLVTTVVTHSSGVWVTRTLHDGRPVTLVLHATPLLTRRSTDRTRRANFYRRACLTAFTTRDPSHRTSKRNYQRVQEHRTPDW